MPIYKLHYLVDVDNEERETVLSLDRPATELDLVQEAAMNFRPNEQQEIGDIVDSLSSDQSGLPLHQDFMAQMGILEIRYTSDIDQAERML